MIYDKTLGRIIPEKEQYDPDDGSSEARGLLGYSETNMLKILVLIFLALLLLLAIGVLMALIYKCCYKRCAKTFKTVFNIIKGKIFFNTILRTSIQSYVSLAISTLFALKSLALKPELSV